MLKIKILKEKLKKYIYNFEKFLKIKKYKFLNLYKFFHLSSTNHKDIGFLHSFFGDISKDKINFKKLQISISITHQYNLYHKKLIIYIYMYFILKYNELLLKYNNKIYLLNLIKFRIKIQNIEKIYTYINIYNFDNLKIYKVYKNKLNKYYNILLLLKNKCLYYLNLNLLKSNEQLIYILYFLYNKYLNLKNIQFDLIFIKYIDLFFYLIKKKKEFILHNYNILFNNSNNKYNFKLFYNIYINNNIINSYNKKFVQMLITNIKTNKVIIYLYKDLYFNKNLYKLIYNNNYFMFFKKILLKQYFNYFFFKNEIINLLDFKKTIKSNENFKKLEVIYKMKDFNFIQNFEISLYDKKFFKKINKYIIQFCGNMEILDIRQYLCMLQENLYMYIHFLYNDIIKKEIENRRLKIKKNLNEVEITNKIKEKQVINNYLDFFINMDQFFHFLLENGSFYINYYLMYFIYNINKYLNIIFLDCKNNKILEYIYNRLKINFFNLFDMYIYLMYEYEDHDINIKILNNEYNYLRIVNIYNSENEKFNYYKHMRRYLFNNLIRFKNEFVRFSKYTYFTDIAFFIKEKNKIDITNSKIIDQIYYNYIFFENKNFYKIDLSLIDERFKIYLDLNILNQKVYEKKYETFFKKSESYELINAYNNVYDTENFINKTSFDFLLKKRKLKDLNKYYFIKQKPEELSSMIFYDNLEYSGLNRLFINNTGNNIEYLRFNFFFKYFIFINRLFLLEYVLLYEYNLQLPEIYKIGPIKYESLVNNVRLKDKLYNFFMKCYNFFINCENFEKYNFKFFNYTIYYGFYIQFIFFFFFFILKKIMDVWCYMKIYFKDKYYMSITEVYENIMEDFGFKFIYNDLMFINYTDYDYFTNRGVFWADSVIKSFGLNGYLNELDNRYILKKNLLSYVFTYKTIDFFFWFIMFDFIKELIVLLSVLCLKYIYIGFLYPIYYILKIFFKSLFLLIEIILFIFFYSLYISLLFIKYSIIKSYIIIHNFIENFINLLERYYILDILFCIIFLYVSIFEIIRVIFIKLYVKFLYKRLLIICSFCLNFLKKNKIIIYNYIYFFFKFIIFFFFKILILYIICVLIFLNYDNIMFFLEKYLYINISYRSIFFFYSISLFILMIMLLYPLQISLYIWYCRYIFIGILLILWLFAGSINSIDILFSVLWDKNVNYLYNFITTYINFYYKFIDPFYLSNTKGSLYRYKRFFLHDIMVDNWFSVYYPGLLKYIFYYSYKISDLFVTKININPDILTFIIEQLNKFKIDKNIFNSLESLIILNNSSFFYYYYLIFTFLYFEQYGFIKRYLYQYDIKGFERAYYNLIINYDIDPMIAYMWRFMYYQNMFNNVRKDLWGNYVVTNENFIEFYGRNWRIEDSKKYRVLNYLMWKNKNKSRHLRKYSSVFIRKKYGMDEPYFIDLYKYELFRGLEYYDFDSFNNSKSKYEFNLIRYNKKVHTKPNRVFTRKEKLLKSLRKYRNDVIKDMYAMETNVVDRTKMKIDDPILLKRMSKKKGKKVYHWNYRKKHKLYSSRLYHYNYLIPDFGFIGSPYWGSHFNYLKFDKRNDSVLFNKVNKRIRFHRY